MKACRHGCACGRGERELRSDVLAGGRRRRGRSCRGRGSSRRPYRSLPPYSISLALRYQQP
eukprot:3077735-Rhodomonas_salina.1